MIQLRTPTKFYAPLNFVFVKPSLKTHLLKLPINVFAFLCIINFNASPLMLPQFLFLKLIESQFKDPLKSILPKDHKIKIKPGLPLENV